MLGFINTLLLGLAYSAPVDDFTAAEIVGGSPVSPPFRYSWLVSLQSSSSHFCGGILLNPTTVLTAAHCSQWSSVAGINVQSHRFDLRKSAGQEAGFVFKVNKITAHPNYSDVTQANDVAVWKVALVQGEASKLPLTTLNFDDGLSSQTGANQTIAGWGTTSSSGSLSKIMLETIVTISQAAYCVKAYPSVDASSICAGYEKGGKDTCQGDSGGPLFIESGSSITLVGLTSYGRGCALPNYPGVYTRISYPSVQNFIKSQL